MEIVKLIDIVAYCHVSAYVHGRLYPLSEAELYYTYHVFCRILFEVAVYLIHTSVRRVIIYEYQLAFLEALPAL